MKQIFFHPHDCLIRLQRNKKKIRSNLFGLLNCAGAPAFELQQLLHLILKVKYYTEES